MMAFPGCTILSYPGEDKRCIHHMLASMYEGPKYIEILNNATKDLIITTTQILTSNVKGYFGIHMGDVENERLPILN